MPGLNTWQVAEEVAGPERFPIGWTGCLCVRAVGANGARHAADGFGPAEGKEDQTTILWIVVPTQVDPLSAITLRDISVVSSRSRFLVKTVGLRPGASPVQG